MNERVIPVVFTVSEIKGILKIGTNSAYNLIHSKSFPVKRIGNSYRIPSEPFCYWLGTHHPELADGLASKSQLS